MDSNAGEAAALFGEPDTANDPFAVAVGQDIQDAPRLDTEGGVNTQSAVASELFNGDSDSMDFFSSTGNNNGNGSEQYVAYGGGTEVAQGYQSDGVSSVAGPNYSQQYQAQNSQSNGYYSGYQPAVAYAPQQPQAYGTPGMSCSML